jgi:hypothetical protein
MRIASVCASSCSVDHYGREAGAGTAIGFIEALQIAYRFFADRPASGSPRYPMSLAFLGCAAVC